MHSSLPLNLPLRGDEVSRRRKLNGAFTFAPRILKCEGLSVQHLSLGPCKLSSAVEHITQQGVAYARHMDPDLVSAAGFKPTHDFRHGLPGFVATEAQGRIMRERGFRSDRT